uniref:Uncharacterized protein n=1 Tax=Meleagris gallopavo TaxID=9103 RepID=A0A803XY50_MELGA
MDNVGTEHPISVTSGTSAFQIKMFTPKSRKGSPADSLQILINSTFLQQHPKSFVQTSFAAKFIFRLNH